MTCMSDEAAKLKVLVVDDEVEITHLLSLYLGNRGYEVLTANTVGDAIGVLESNPDIDAVLLDIMLPDGNGVEFLKHVRAYLPDAAIIMVTGVNDLDTVVRAMKNGADDYLTKPFRLAQLDEKIESALHRKSVATLERGITAEEAIGALEKIKEHGVVFTFSFDTVDEMNRFMEDLKRRDDVKVVDVRIGDHYDVSVKKSK